MYRKTLTEEDEENIDFILNPYPKIVEDTLKSIDDTESVDEKNKLIEKLSCILAQSEAAGNPLIQKRFSQILEYLKNDDLYNNTALLISDACRHMKNIQDMFVDLGVFELINYGDKYYKYSISLVFSLCYGNKDVTSLWLNKYYRVKRDSKNGLIKQIIEEKNRE